MVAKVCQKIPKVSAILQPLAAAPCNHFCNHFAPGPRLKTAVKINADGLAALDLSAALARLLTTTIDADRYPLSPRIQTLKAILAKIRPEPARQPLPPPPRATAARRR